MTPQAQFMVVAALTPGREAGLRRLLDAMNAEPGLADPRNAVIPFAAFEGLHFARLVLLDDALQVDLEAHGLRPAPLPTVLAFMGDCDGPARDCLEAIAQRAAAGLHALFSHCEGYTPGADLLAWMLARNHPPAAAYVHWVGRTVQQVRQESALQRALAARVPRAGLSSPEQALQLRSELQAFVAAELAAGRLALSAAAPTPVGWRISQGLNLIAVPLAGLLLLPLLVLAAPFVAWRLRQLESRDPELCPRPSEAVLQDLEQLEDRDASNQYTAIGAVKPGRFRRVLVTLLLLLIDYACRHVFTRGFLARVQTIHFARWVFLDDKTRVVFVSNYDGSHQGYMDDFINKVAWGLNLVFSNGVGWPRTRWLILGGARIEQRFKYFQRRHQLPTQVWYKAYPGLTLADLLRNQRIRAGLQQSAMSGAQAMAWLQLL